MIIRRAEKRDIRAALDVANVQFGGNLYFKKLEDISGPRVKKFRVRLTVEDLDMPGCRRGYLSYAYGFTNRPRRIRAACFHATGVWMTCLLERCPDAIIESGSMHLAGGRYRGVRGFLLNYQSVGAQNIGSKIMPIAFEASCNCDEFGTDYIDTDTLRYSGFETAIPGGTRAGAQA
jgi:hypothetical protein